MEAIREKEAEAARKIELRNRRRAAIRMASMDMSPVPTAIPDATLITFTLLIDPPPPFDMVPPPTWYDPATAMALHFQKELLGIEEKQVKYRKPPRFLNARSSLEMYKNWENVFLRRQLATSDDYEYASLASSLQYGRKDRESDDSDSDRGSSSSDGSSIGSDESSENAGDVEDDSNSNMKDESDDILESGEDLSKPYEDGIDTNDEIRSDNGDGLEVQVEETSNVKVNERTSDTEPDQDVPVQPERDNEDKGEDEAIKHNLNGDEIQRDQIDTERNLVTNDNDGEDNALGGSDNNILDEKLRKGSHGNSTRGDNDESSVDNSNSSKNSTITSKRKKNNRRVESKATEKPLAQYQLKAIAKQLWANYKDKHAGAAVFIKDVFDDSNRKRFENTLLDEISTCACIPQKFFAVEEIRRLAPNDDLLKKFKKKKQDFFLEEDRLAEQKLKEAEDVMKANMELVAKISEMAQQKREEEAKLLQEEQTLASEEKSVRSIRSVLSRLDSRRLAKEDESSRNDMSTSRSGTCNTEGERVKKFTKDSTHGGMDTEDEDSFFDHIETEESRRRKLKFATRKGSSWGVKTQEAFEMSLKEKEEAACVADSSSLSRNEENLNGSQSVILKKNGSTDSNSIVKSVILLKSEGETQCDKSQNLNDDSNGLVTRDRFGSVDNSTIVSGVSKGNDENIQHNDVDTRKSAHGESVALSRFTDERFKHRIGSFVGVEGTSPLDARDLCITIANPEDVRHDPNHWMAKLLREETAYEKQLRRIEYLKLLNLKGTTRVQILKEKIKIVQQKQRELNEIAESYLGPTLKVVKKAVKPISTHIQKKSVQCAKEIAKEMRRRRELSKLGDGAEDDGAITFTRKSVAIPQSSEDIARDDSQKRDVSENSEVMSGSSRQHERIDEEEQGALLDDAASRRENAPEIMTTDETAKNSSRLVDDNVDNEARTRAQNIVTTASSAAAVAQDNINSDEEAKHREMLTTIRDKLVKEEEELLNDLEANSTSGGGPAVERESSEKDLLQDSLKHSSRSGINNDIISLHSLPPPPPVDFDGVDSHDMNITDSREMSSDEHEVMGVLNVMCHTVMNRVDERYDIYDEYLELWDQKDRPDREEDLIGCQVSLMVHVDDTLKESIYLEDLQSEDIAVMLYNQLWDRLSPLNTMGMTKHIVGIEHKSVYKKRPFDEWEHYWVHSLTPTFFRYCTKPCKKERFVAPREPGRLKSGVMLVNPTDNFDENQKAIFMGLVQPQSKFEIDDPNAAETLNFDVDDIGAELFDDSGAPKLSIYRPNMNEISKREVEKCKRIYRGFLDKYNTEMQFGLARGGLRANQYAALKDMETSKRIYDIAKQKFARDTRLENEGPAFVPQITRISTEKFAEWMKEAKDEEAEELRKKRIKKLQQIELRKQEAEMRRRYAQQKNWMYVCNHV